MNEDYQRLRHLLLPRYGAGEAQAIAFLVMEEVMHLTRTDIYAGKVSQISEDERARFANICQSLAEGMPADITIADMDSCYKIDKSKFVSKGRNTPFDGCEVFGRVFYTIVDGKVVYTYEGGEEE